MNEISPSFDQRASAIASVTAVKTPVVSDFLIFFYGISKWYDRNGVRLVEKGKKRMTGVMAST